jgi:hypothetical protein
MLSIAKTSGFPEGRKLRKRLPTEAGSYWMVDGPESSPVVITFVPFAETLICTHGILIKLYHGALFSDRIPSRDADV